MAPTLRLQPNPFDDDPSLGPNTAQVAPPPLTATPPAAPPGGTDLTQMASPDVQSAGPTGMLAGQKLPPIAAAPANPASQMFKPPADFGQIGQQATAQPPATASSSVTPQGMTEDDLRIAKQHGDELRRRTEENYTRIMGDHLLSTAEHRLAAQAEARQQAEAEVSPKFMQAMIMARFQDRKLGNAESTLAEQTRHHTVDEGTKSAGIEERAQYHHGAIGLRGQQLDINRLNAMAGASQASSAAIIAEATARGLDTKQKADLFDLHQKVMQAAKDGNAGAATSLLQQGPTWFQDLATRVTGEKVESPDLAARRQNFKQGSEDVQQPRMDFRSQADQNNPFIGPLQDAAKAMNRRNSATPNGQPPAVGQTMPGPLDAASASIRAGGENILRATPPTVMRPATTAVNPPPPPAASPSANQPQDQAAKAVRQNRPRPLSSLGQNGGEQEIMARIQKQTGVNDDAILRQKAQYAISRVSKGPPLDTEWEKAFHAATGKWPTDDDKAKAAGGA